MTISRAWSLDNRRLYIPAFYSHMPLKRLVGGKSVHRCEWGFHPPPYKMLLPASVCICYYSLPEEILHPEKLGKTSKWSTWMNNRPRWFLQTCWVFFIHTSTDAWWVEMELWVERGRHTEMLHLPKFINQPCWWLEKYPLPSENVLLSLSIHSRSRQSVKWQRLLKGQRAWWPFCSS